MAFGKERRLKSKKANLIRVLGGVFSEKLASLIPKRREEISEVILLQAGPSFFAFEPILNALKKAPIPLSHILTQPPEDHSSQPDDALVTFPGYLEIGGTFNLGFLCKHNASQHPRYVFILRNGFCDY